MRTLALCGLKNRERLRSRMYGDDGRLRRSSSADRNLPIFFHSKKHLIYFFVTDCEQVVNSNDHFCLKQGKNFLVDL